MTQDKTYQEIIINDAIHGIMHFPEYLKEFKAIADTKVFQRLRHIKQLGMCDLVFPTATHTRFNHSLGAAFIASEMCRKIGIDKQDDKHSLFINTVIAALLHDIGHGPFSHAFEKLLLDDDKKPLISHEDWTDRFIQEIRHNISEEYDKSIKWELIIQFIKHTYKKSTNQYECIAADIISSQLDCDRLDYLLRDSHFSGVPYGNHNLAWILNNLIPIKTSDGYHLGIIKKGVAAVEDFLLSRRMMNYSIYFHPKVVACEYLLIEFLKSLLEKDVLKTIEGKINIHLLSFLKSCTEITSFDKQKFIDINFEHYKEICDYDIWSLIRNLANSNDKNITNLTCYKIAKRFQERKLPKGIRIKDQFKEDIHLMVKEIQDSLEKDKWRIAFSPRTSPIYKSKKGALYVINQKEHPPIRCIEYEAPILGQVADKDDGCWILIYDTFDPTEKMTTTIEDTLKKCF